MFPDRKTKRRSHAMGTKLLKSATTTAASGVSR